jgi:hypothetical protein
MCTRYDTHRGGDVGAGHDGVTAGREVRENARRVADIVKVRTPAHHLGAVELALAALHALLQWEERRGRG